MLPIDGVGVTVRMRFNVLCMREWKIQLLISSVHRFYLYKLTQMNGMNPNRSSRSQLLSCNTLKRQLMSMMPMNGVPWAHCGHYARSPQLGTCTALDKSNWPPFHWSMKTRSNDGLSSASPHLAHSSAPPANHRMECVNAVAWVVLSQYRPICYWEAPHGHCVDNHSHHRH